MPDPNLGIETKASLKVPKDRPTKADIDEARRLIAQLHYPQIWKVGAIFKSKLVRLDGQKSTSGKNANLQIQLNEVPRPSTIAGVLVDEDLRDYGASQQAASRVIIEQKVREALIKSLTHIPPITLSVVKK